MSTETVRPAIGEAEEVTLTLPAACKWVTVETEAGEDTVAPHWDTRWGGATAFTGGVDFEDGYREDLAELRAEALAMLAAVTAAERYQTETRDPSTPLVTEISHRNRVSSFRCLVCHAAGARAATGSETVTPPPGHEVRHRDGEMWLVCYAFDGPQWWRLD